MLGPVDLSTQAPPIAMVSNFSLVPLRAAADIADGMKYAPIGGGRGTNDHGRRADAGVDLGQDRSLSKYRWLLRSADALAHGCIDQAQRIMQQKLAGQIDALWFGQLQRAVRMSRFVSSRGLASHEAVTHAYMAAAQRHMESMGMQEANATEAMFAKSDQTLSPEDKETARKLRGPPVVIEWGDSLLEHGEIDATGQPP